MISAEKFSEAGKKYIGRSYEEMDCQKFYEKAAADAGLIMDLKGSNAWYRKFLETGWVGSPEECKARFGSIPKGATLFIHAYDGGEVKRDYHDGKGNASHIGIKTGTGMGAIHSSQTAGGVAESLFKDKTIKNGGWNTVGLSALFDYGEKINKILRGENQAEDQEGNEEMTQTETATIWTPTNTTANMRSKPKKNASLVDRVPDGETVIVLEHNGDGWCRVKWGNRTGWIMTEFLLIGEDNPAENMDPGDGFPETPGVITIRISTEAAPAVLEILEGIAEQITDQMGRG